MPTKKEPLKKVVMSFSYSLNISENKVKALNEILNSQDFNQFNADTSASIILSDDIIFTGCMQFPPFSGGKLNDAFETKFKICYPDFSSYFLNYSLYEKNNSNSFILYTIAKVKLIDDLKNVITKHNKTVKSVNYLSDLILSNNKTRGESISTKLIVGTHQIELIIAKGKTIVGKSIIEVGTDKLFNDMSYLNSTYNVDSETAYKYSSIHILNFETKDSVTDDSIRQTKVHESLGFTDPREVRLLKGDSLNNYCLRQNIRKIHAHILDNIEYFSKAPWFFPIHDVEIIGDKRLFEQFSAMEEESDINYIQSDSNIEELLCKDISNNILFTKILKQKERRKIDWQKFLSMEIGKKKKA
jgi:hypothetical protein